MGKSDGGCSKAVAGVFGCLIGTGLLVAVVIGGCGLVFHGLSQVPPPKPTKYGQVDDIRTIADVKETAEDAVKPYLKFPNDASFSWFPNVFQHPDGKFLVDGEVTIQNAFGAHFKHHYRVSMILTDEAQKNWQVIAVVIDGKIIEADMAAAKLKPAVPAAGAEAVSKPAGAVSPEKPAPAKPEPDPAKPLPETAAIAKPAPEKPAKVVPPATGEQRTWNQTDGTQWRGTFVALALDEVRLRAEDGSIIRVKMRALTKADQDFARSELARQRLGSTKSISP